MERLAATKKGNLLSNLRRTLLRRVLRQHEACGDSAFSPQFNNDSALDVDFCSRWNELWPRIRDEVAFWRSARLPETVATYQEFRAFPVITRRQIQENPRLFTAENLAGTVAAATGGSTGAPLRFPLLKDELEVGRRNQIFARKLYNIALGDRCSMIWGHAAQLESTWRAGLERRIRAIKDAFLGYHRVSAYLLTREILRHEFEEMCAYGSQWVYAYSSSLLAFTRANADRVDRARNLRLKACIAAAEPMPDEARKEVEEFFGCPVGMEYGSVEMRVVAHTHPSFPGYFVFTCDYLLEALPAKQEGVYDVVVTKLFHSAMPLIRYQVGDQIVINDSKFSGGPVMFFDKVLGRTNDNLSFGDGIEVHSETITHAVRSELEVIAFQLHQYADRMELHLVTRSSALSNELQTRIRGKLARVHPAFEAIHFVKAEDVSITSAGKRRWIVRHP